MKNLALFSWKDESKKSKCRLLQFLYGAVRVKFLNVQLTLVLSNTDISKFLLISKKNVWTQFPFFPYIQLLFSQTTSIQCFR